MDMNDKMRKSFIELNQNIEADIDKTYQKLYDKYVNLELSHNRKKKALIDIENLIQQPEFKIQTHDIINDCPKVLYFFPVDKIDLILKKIDNVLFCDGRERERIKK